MTAFSNANDHRDDERAPEDPDVHTRQQPRGRHRRDARRKPRHQQREQLEMRGRSGCQALDRPYSGPASLDIALPSLTYVRSREAGLEADAPARRTQRKPRCVVDESIAWPWRAAGR